jgi:hypothetical protein
MATQTAGASAPDAHPGVGSPPPGVGSRTLAARSAAALTGLRGIDPLRAAGVIPGVLIVAWLLVAFPALLLGLFYPIPVTVIAAIPAAALVRWVLPVLRVDGGHVARTPWWSVASVVVIAAACGTFAAFTHSSQLIIQRDAGSYAQIGYWLAHNPRLPISVQPRAFGDAINLLGFDSAAFYPKGDSLIPQFMSGWPMLLALGYQVAGWGGLFWLSGLVGALSVASVGALAGRLIGPRWAPLAALVVAVTWPMIHVFQGPYSEPIALLLLTTGLALATCVIGDPRTPVPAQRARWAALTAGLLIGLGQLVRLDAGVEVALLFPVAGWWWMTRRPGALPFAGGLLLGFGLGCVDMWVVTLPYVQGNWQSVKMMLFALGASAAVTIIVSCLARAQGYDERRPRWWRVVPTAAAALVLLAAAALLVRPYVQTSRTVTDVGVIDHTSLAQVALGLPIDGSRSYAEQSLRWVSWYVGWPLLALALLAAVPLTWRALRGRSRPWLAVLPVLLGSTALTLINPGITPDHPWADRRLVVVVFPCVILLAVWAIARVVPRLYHSWLPGRWHRKARWTSLALCTALCLAPTAAAAFPISLDRTEQAEPAAIDSLCAQLKHTDSVISIDIFSSWLPVIRGECGVPAAYVVPAPMSVTKVNIARAAAAIRAAGRTPVVIASNPDLLKQVGLHGVQVVDIDEKQDAQELVKRPTGVMPETYTLWMARP